jgi:hypothetical protein
MRILAVFVSPFAGLCLVGSSVLLLETFNSGLRINFEAWFSFLFLSYSVALAIQIIFVELILINSTTTYRRYIEVAVISCILIEVLVLLFKTTLSFADFLETIEVFLFFYVYSIGNVLAYNYLYFKQLENKPQP